MTGVKSRGRHSTFASSLALLCLARRGRLWAAEQVQPFWEEPSGAAGPHHSLCCLLPDFPQHCQRCSNCFRGRNRPAGLHYPQVRQPQSFCYNKRTTAAGGKNEVNLCSCCRISESDWNHVCSKGSVHCCTICTCSHETFCQTESESFPCAPLWAVFPLFCHLNKWNQPEENLASGHCCLSYQTNNHITHTEQETQMSQWQTVALCFF